MSTYLLIYLTIKLAIYLSTHLPTCPLLIHQPTHPHNQLLMQLSNHLHAYLSSTYLLTYLSIDPPKCSSFNPATYLFIYGVLFCTYQPTYLPTYLHTYQMQTSLCRIEWCDQCNLLTPNGNIVKSLPLCAKRVGAIGELLGCGQVATLVDLATWHF